MNRDEKSTVVSELNESFNRAKFTVVADYCGLTVLELQELRGELRKCDSEIRVAKNTLLKRAVTNTTSELLVNEFSGTSAVVMAYDDPILPAKALTRFADGHAKFKIRCATLEGDKLTLDDLIVLSKLPTKEVLLGQLLSVLNGVPTGLVQVLSAVPRTFLYGLRAIEKQKEQIDN